MVAKSPSAVAELRAIAAVSTDRRAETATLESALCEAFRSGTVAHWSEQLQVAGASVHRYCPKSEVLQDADVLRAGLVVRREFPGIGHGRTIGVVTRFASMPARSTSPAVRPGLHTEEVLRQAGYAAADYDALESNGVVNGPIAAGSMLNIDSAFV